MNVGGENLKMSREIKRKKEGRGNTVFPFKVLVIFAQMQ